MYFNHPELRVARKNAEKMSGKVETRPTEKGDFWKDFVAGREAPLEFMESECLLWREISIWCYDVVWLYNLLSDFVWYYWIYLMLIDIVCCCLILYDAVWAFHTEGWEVKYTTLGGGFKHFLFSSLFGEDSHFDWYFSNGLKPPTRTALYNWI